MRKLIFALSFIGLLAAAWLPIYPASLTSAAASI